jgi:hypothetical protein
MKGACPAAARRACLTPEGAETTFVVRHEPEHVLDRWVPPIERHNGAGGMIAEQGWSHAVPEDVAYVT